MSTVVRWLEKAEGPLVHLSGLGIRVPVEIFRIGQLGLCVGGRPLRRPLEKEAGFRRLAAFLERKRLLGQVLRSRTYKKARDAQEIRRKHPHVRFSRL